MGKWQCPINGAGKTGFLYRTQKRTWNSLKSEM